MGGNFSTAAARKPSGTAKALLEIMNADHEYEEVYGRSGMCGARKKEIGVHSLRGGTEAGEHTVYFFGDQETITITHHAADRKIFFGALPTPAKLYYNIYNINESKEHSELPADIPITTAQCRRFLTELVREDNSLSSVNGLTSTFFPILILLSLVIISQHY